MPLPVIANVYRCTLKWGNLLSGVKPENVLHVVSPGDTAANVGADLIDAIVANPATYSMMPGASVLDQCDVLELDGTSGTVTVVGNAASVITAGTGNDVPESSIRITLQTGLAGPARRGRQFIGPLTEDNIANGMYVPTIGTVTAAWNALLVTLTASRPVGGGLAVASYVHGDYAAVTNCLARVNLGTQRRRLLQTR